MERVALSLSGRVMYRLHSSIGHRSTCSFRCRCSGSQPLLNRIDRNIVKRSMSVIDDLMRNIIVQ